MIYHKDTKAQREDTGLEDDTFDAVFEKRHMKVDEQAETMAEVSHLCVFVSLW